MELDNVNTSTEAALDATAENAGAADQPDAFLNGFDDAENPGTADQPEQDDGEAAQGAQKQTADQPDAGASGAQADTQGKKQEADGNADQQGQSAPKEWIVKHMDEQRTLTAKDITPELLQKGLDYDRVRGKYDEARPVMEMFSALAAKAGMSVQDFAKSIRAEQKKAQGMSEADARRTVELEDREAAVSAAEAEKQAAAKASEQRSARVRADIAEFARAFPDVYKQAEGNPKNVIPPDVWSDVDRGMSLVAAYSRYAVAQAEAKAKAADTRAETADKNATNAARSTGSQKSAGSDAKADSFLAGFDG